MDKRRVKRFKYRNHIADNKRLWGIYNGIKRRCLSEKEPRYPDYGGRGIKICDEWLSSFDNFADWAKLNGYYSHLTIERTDNNGDYCPENCTWITRVRQSYNKRTSVMVTYLGETKCLMDWCTELGLTYDAIHNRITKGWSAEDALTKPIFDQSKSFSQMCRNHGIHPSTVKSRTEKFGWSLEDALNTPSSGRGANSKTYSLDSSR